jgi:hypothetical protein
MSKKEQKKEDKKPAKLLTLDTETRGFGGEVFRIGLFDGKNYYVANSFDDIMNVFKQYCDYECHVYVHNLDFDLAKIAPTLFKIDSVDFSQSIFINSSVVTLTTNTIILHDSVKLLVSSLEKLCQDFGLIDNGKKDLTEYIKENGYAVYHANGKYNKKASLGNFFMNVPAEDEVLNEYLEYDCRSLYTILEMVMDFTKVDLNSLVKCPTAASLAMKVYQTQYEADYNTITEKSSYNGPWGKFLENFVRQAYYGGRTEVFKPIMRNGFHYDVNSLYPYVMKVAKFPVGFAEHLEGDKAKSKWEFWKRRGMGGGVMWCRVNVPEDMHIPPLPRHDNGKLLFPVGKLEGVWTLPEILEAEKLGCTVEKVEAMIYWKRMEYVFKDFVEYFETIKNESKGAKRTLAKLLQNSLYGKFGMKRIRSTFKNIEQLDKVKREAEKYRVHEHTKNGLNLKFVEHLMESKAQYIQPHIAAYVTSYARILLLRGLLEQQRKGEVAYCDTDSIAGTASMLPEMVHDKEYGKWKLEGVVMEGIFLQPKFYAEKYEDGEIVLKAKGIPKDEMEKLSYSDYEKWLEIIKEGSQDRIEIFGYDKKIEARKKFISTLKASEDFDKMREMKKSMNLLLEQKRVMDYENETSRPHARYDYGDNFEKRMLQESIADQLKELDQYDDVDEIKEQIEEHGYIRVPVKGEYYFRDYEVIPARVKRMYFRKVGLSIDLWAEASGWEVNELLEELRLTI